MTRLPYEVSKAVAGGDGIDTPPPHDGAVALVGARHGDEVQGPGTDADDAGCVHVVHIALRGEREKRGVEREIMHELSSSALVNKIARA